jgi:hypothetical protein
LGHEISQGFYYVRIQESDAVHWASMKLYWNERTIVMEDDGRKAAVLVSGPDVGTGFSATVSNRDSTAWQLTGLSWWSQSGQEKTVPLEYNAVDSTESDAIVLLPYGVNAYQVRLITTESVPLDSLKFRIATQSVVPIDTTVTTDQ